MATTITDYQTPQTVSAPGATTWERLDLPQNTRFVRIQSTGAIAWSHQGTDGGSTAGEAVFSIAANVLFSVNPAGVLFGKAQRAPNGSPVLYVAGAADIVVQAEK
jgi:hypothetical protein